jgi:hypothetical protein
MTPHRLDVTLTAPFPIDDVVVRVTLESGVEIPQVACGGRLVASFEARPVRIRLSDEPIPDDVGSRRPPDSPELPSGEVADVTVLFEHGWDVPEDGRVALQVLWGAHCHSAGPPTDRRFGSMEHMASAELIGLDESGSPAVIAGIAAPFRDTTPLLGPRGSTLSFAQIVALAGDFYAYYDRDAANRLAWAWPENPGFLGWLAADYRSITLTGDPPDQWEILLRHIASGSTNAAGEFAALAFKTVVEHYPARRYLALSSQNFCHFA